MSIYKKIEKAEAHLQFKKDFDTTRWRQQEGSFQLCFSRQYAFSLKNMNKIDFRELYPLAMYAYAEFLC